MRTALLLSFFLFAIGGLEQALIAAPNAYNEGQRAYVAGDLETAKQKFKAALQANPNNTLARNYLAMIAGLEKKSAAPTGSQLEKQLAAIVLPKIDFKDATLPAVLDFLTQQSTTLSSGKATANFVVTAPTEAAAKRVTLALTNVPFLEALRYIGDLTGMKFAVEKYAIRVTAATPSL